MTRSLLVALAGPCVLALSVGCSGDPEEGGGSCDDRTAAAGKAISDAAATAAAGASCSADDECVVVQLSSSCSEDCGAVVTNHDGATRIDAARNDAQSRICATFGADGCTVTYLPCASPPSGARCVSGLCEAVQ